MNFSGSAVPRRHSVPEFSTRGCEAGICSAFPAEGGILKGVLGS